MRKILIAMTILLTGCQTTNQSLNTASSGGKKNTRYASQRVNNSIYNRYKNKSNRYTQYQDGAPTKQKKINFKEPVPTKEPLSRYGNPSEYSVDGRSYQVMRNSSGYKTRGVASWYGTKFHKQRTSSGEPYNMYVMSAAHKTLPLPTYIKVKNLDNGKEAIVKVNDRGPFHSNRIIDLSYAAALKLGVFPKGTANVEIETLAGPGQARYYIQAGAFTTEASAKRLKEKLVRITSLPVSIERYRRNYIVRVGPFGSKNTADGLKRKLALNGVRGSFSVLI
ncbi:rare lipoprotein A [Legionella santicrucis]|uniref:Endolytic peptidoglycan transglycosylase RlpA n=1 Tax=Legionella santicrucis TaxID=45074 RepID=A0A0W0Y894_9GAMM|nr:septal ring lytic transglycosylase RlpA family protein [Legionella santicrucis]KTD53160.1 rare lipoprotein A [Legionella santicrucis]